MAARQGTRALGAKNTKVDCHVHNALSEWRGRTNLGVAMHSTVSAEQVQLLVLATKLS